MNAQSNALSGVRSRRGRRPASESRSKEVRDKVAAWKLTPPERRQPPTMRALAAELRVSKSTVEYYSKQTPDSIEDLIDSTERDALRRNPSAINTLFDLAEKGSVEAIKTILRGIVEPRRPPRPRSDLKQDVTLQLAISTLLPGAPTPTQGAQPGGAVPALPAQHKMTLAGGSAGLSPNGPSTAVTQPVVAEMAE